MKVLAIESTCDETAAAIVREKNGGVEVLSDVVASSIELVKKYGGVVPEVAAREQVTSIVPVIQEAIEQFSIFNFKFSIKDIDAIAVTYGPGLMGSLLVGTETAKVLATVWKKPLIRVNHLNAHLAANWLVQESGIKSQELRIPKLPAVGLIVSGGHTDFIYIKDFNDWEWVGGTRDDAAGGAFDKAARVLGQPYPGGPSIQSAAEEFRIENLEFRIFGNLKLPRPMIQEDNLEMSFSGLKTALAKQALELRGKSQELREEVINALANEFNLAVVDILVSKLERAIEKYRPRSVLIGGGVSANKMLRQNLELRIKSQEEVELFIPEFKYCTDNAAMVGAAAILKPDYIEPVDLKPEPGLGIE